MRIVSWNCKGAFYRKHHLACDLNPDILIVPECEKLANCLLNFKTRAPQSFEWIGDNSKKGIAVFSFGEYRFEILPFFNPRHRWVVPLKVSGPKSFTLLAVWTLPDRDTGSYVQPIMESLDEYLDKIESDQIYIMGDFNANVIFDRPNRIHKFGDLVTELQEKGIRSLFHEQHGDSHGSEGVKTFYMYHHQERGYHIDFIFGGRGIARGKYDVSIGSFDNWSKHSDHAPLVYTELL